jgi:hypothetical protein
MIRTLAVGFVSLFLVVAVQAANTGFDRADNSPYEPGNTWTTNQNGGTGFGAWTLNGPGDNTGSHGGFFMGSSTANGSTGSLGIDTSGVSWAMYANSLQLVDAIRPLTGGSLLVGQKITLSIDNGLIIQANNDPSGGSNGSAGSEGFGLQTSGGTSRIEFFFNGGNTDYTLADGTGFHDTGIGFTTNGLALAFTLTGSNSYSLDVTPNGGSTTNFTGSLEGGTGLDIGRLRFFDFNGAGNDLANGTKYNFYANLLTVPEPSTWIAGGLSVVSCVFIGLRRRLAVARR